MTGCTRETVEARLNVTQGGRRVGGPRLCFRPFCSSSPLRRHVCLHFHVQPWLGFDALRRPQLLPRRSLCFGPRRSVLTRPAPTPFSRLDPGLAHRPSLTAREPPRSLNYSVLIIAFYPYNSPTDAKAKAAKIESVSSTLRLNPIRCRVVVQQRLILVAVPSITVGREQVRGCQDRCRHWCVTLSVACARQGSVNADRYLIARSVGGQQAAAKVQAKSIALYSPEYYYTCALGGILACGTTHALVTPLDLVKCRKQ